MRILDFFRTGPDRPPVSKDQDTIRSIYEKKRLSVFLSVTFGYGFFYVCRINFSVVKKPMLDNGILNAKEMGWVGFAMLMVYAVGKLVNGFLADRSNIRRFFSTGLLLSAIINLMLGMTNWFVVFVVLWGLNGWFQATGSAPSVVSLSQWFSTREKGTRYGIWSTCHSIGEGVTFLVTAALVSVYGWRWGFAGPGLICLVAAFVLFRTLADRPQTYGLPSVAEYKNDVVVGEKKGDSVWAMQLEVIRKPAVWILGLSSASLYVARYGINNWGILYLQEGKNYSLIDAGIVMSAYPFLGLLGAACSGIISDRFFNSKRNVPALLFGLLVLFSLIAFFKIPPGYFWADAFTMAIFGFALGGQLVFLGGLMAVDICSPRAAGAAMGVVGLFSYMGAAIQDAISGYLIDAGKVGTGDSATYSFEGIYYFWVSAAILSLVLVMMLWNTQSKLEVTAKKVKGV